jgi:hypothetical protein
LLACGGEKSKTNLKTWQKPEIGTKMANFVMLV